MRMGIFDRNVQILTVLFDRFECVVMAESTCIKGEELN
jgi:hypothetical protein